MAKATVQASDIATAPLVREVDITPEMLGTALLKAFGRMGWNSQEAARELNEDDSEIGKWLNGTRNAKLWKLLRHSRALRRAVLMELFALDGHAEIVTEIRWKDAVGV